MRLLILAVVALLGCDDDWCDPGHTLEQGVCLEPAEPDAEPTDADVGAAPDAGVDAVVVDADPNALPELFGADCTEQSDCDFERGGCAIQPGMDVGYCTFQHCDAGAMDCPEGHTCFDLSAFTDEFDTMCVRQ